ncbi:MAG: Ig domain protein group 2 domain protein [Bacteroidetes bacterium]|nr:Ig domain protein group 2 domain protein [Bacteroidota bacterium]
MKKYVRFIFPLFLFSFYISEGQQARLPVTTINNETSKLSQKTGKINFSGFVGKAGSPITGEMTTSKSPEIVKKECTFFSGDSLKGFEFDKIAGQLDNQNYKLYVEFRNMMYRSQCDFIKNKYNLSNFPNVPANLQHTEPPVIQASSCANLDFENGNFGNWVGSSGYNTNSNGNLTVPAAGAGTAIFTTNQNIYTCTDINLITSAYGNDPLGFPGLDPNGGTYSARVGGFHINTCNYGGDGFICDGYKWSSVYSNGEILEQTFNVTAANALVSFDYAVVLNDGGHGNGQQPYFHVYVKNAGTGAILSTCTQYYVQAPAGMAPPGFVNSGYVNSGDGSVVYYKNWTSNSINLTPYIGQSVNIEFVAAGCTAGAHIGYAYVDVTCGPADLLASNSSPCSGGSVTLTAPAISGGSYLWSGPGVTGLTSQVVSVNTTGTYSVTVTPSQGAACAYTLTKSLTFGAPTVAISSVSNATICSNNSSLITPSGATTYTLLNTGATGTSFNVSPSSTTTYSIIGASGGCVSTNTITATINVNPTPTLAISSVSNPVICSNNSSTITPGGANTYTLLNTGATGTSFNVSPTGTTTYSIIGTNSAGCPGTNTITTTITVNTTPTVAISSVSSPTICSNNSSLITPSGASSYTLLNTGATGTSFNVSPSGTTTYSIVGAGSAGCPSTNTITTTITVNTTPTVAISSVSNPTICSNNNSLITPSGASTYTLLNTGATGTSFNVSPTGTTTYSIIGTANGCTSTNTITTTITVNTTPTIAISSVSSPTICSNNSSIITPSGASTYTLLNTGATGTSFNVSPTGTTTYSIVGAGIAGCPSTNTVTTTIIVNSSPTLAISSVSNPTLCSGNSSLITPSGASTYTLVNTGATGTSFNVSPTTATTYSIIGSNGGSCPGTNTITTTINVSTSPTVAISAVSNPTICSGNNSLITPSGTSTYTLLNSGATGTSFNVNPTGTTTYSIVGSSGSCNSTNTITTTVSVTASPTIAISAVSNPTVCSNNSTLITPSGAGTYTLLNTGATGTSFNVSPGGTTTYSIVGLSGSCPGTNTITTTITVNTSPTVAISSVSSPTICSGNSSLITPSGASTYTLLNTGATGASFNVSPSGTTTYSIVGANSAGCPGTNTITTTVAVNASPTLAISSVSNPTICSGNSSLITPSGADTYTLMNSGATGTSFNVSPTGTTTYSIIGQSTINCPSTNTLTTTITVNNSPTLAISAVSNPTICSGNNSLITPGGANTYTLLNNGATGTSFNVSPTGTTTYSIAGTSSASCPSTNTITTTITVNNTPTLNISSNNVSLCAGNPLVLPSASGGGTYSWTGPNSFTSSLAGPTVTSSVAAANAGVYNVSTSITYGSLICTSSTGQVTVSVVSSAVISVPNSNLCEGLTATVTPNGGNSYTLTSTGEITTGSFTLNPTTTTAYSVTGTAGAGCSGNTTFTITVLPTSTVAVTSNSTTICSGAPVVITPNGATTYTLNPGNLSGSTFTVSPALTTTYSVIGTNSVNCVSTNTANIVITVNNSPSVTISANSNSICAGASVILTPGGANSYTLSPGGLSGTSFTLSPSGPSATYSITGTSNLNCASSNTANITITVNALPTFTLGTANSLTATCSSPTVSLSANSDAGVNSIYTWSTPVPSTLTGNPISASTAGIYTVSVSNTLTGCINASPQNTVQVIADAGIPFVTLSSNTLTITCSNPTPSVSVSTTATPVSYSWSPAAGIVPGTETTANPIFNAAGLYSVVVTNTASGCATSIASNVVDVTEDNNPPVVSFTTATNSGIINCTDPSLTVTPVLPTGSFTYTWSPGIGISTPINQITATFTAAGVYTLAVTNTITGCVSSATNTANTFTVVPDTVRPISSIGFFSSNSTIGCGGTNTVVTLEAITNPSNATLTWLPGGATSPQFNVTSADTIFLIAINPTNGCRDTARQIVSGNINPPQYVDAGTTVFIPCNSQTISLVGVTATPNCTYSWAGPTPTAIITGSATTNPIVGEAGIYTLTVTRNDNGCQGTATVSVVKSVVNAAFSADPTSGISPLTVNFTDGSSGASIWTWNFGDSSPLVTYSPVSQNPTNVFTTGTYTVTLIASSGLCSDTASVVIVVENGLSLEIPNVFTPNGDGSNEVFTIKSTGIKEISLQVFNRWGEKLYEFTGPKASWDGLAPNGILVPEGTYFYFVNATGFDETKIERKGTLNLFR